MSAPQIRSPGQLKVPELREELKKRGITPKGLKKDLVEKLEEALRKEGEEQFGNTPSSNLPQQVPSSSNLPLPGSSGVDLIIPSSSDCYTPLPLPDSTEAYSPVPSDGYNSPSQVADTKSLHHVSDQQAADHTTPGDIGDGEVKGNESEWMLPAANVHSAASLVLLSASKPEKMEYDNQKEEQMEQFNSARKSPVELVHCSEGFCHDNREGGAADDSEMAHTVNKEHESGVDVSGPEALGFVACYQNPGLIDKTMETNLLEASHKDERSISSHEVSSAVEKCYDTLNSVGEEPMELEDGHIQLRLLVPLMDRPEAEATINSEKTEARISENVADQCHQKKISDYQLEKQEEKGNSLTAYKDDILKISEAGSDSIDRTKSEVIAVSQKAIGVEHKNQSASTHPTAQDLKSEPGHNYQEEEAAILKQDMVVAEPPKGADKWESREQENDSCKVPKLSGTDQNFEDMQRSETNLDSSEDMEPRFAQNQCISLQPPVHDLESKPKINLEGGEIDHLKQNKDEYYHSMGPSSFESKKTEDIENTSSFNKGLKLETDLNSAEQQKSSGDILESKAVQSQHITSHSTSKELIFEHTGSTGILEDFQHKQNQEEYDNPVILYKLKSEDQETQENTSTYQSDEVFEGYVECKIGQSHQSSLDIPHHEFEYEPRSNIGEREAKGLHQTREEHHQCRKVGVHKFEEENKVIFSGCQNDKLFQLCETDPSLAEEGKQETVSALEESMKSEDLHSESIDNSIFNESEFKPRANSEVLEVKDEHLRKEEHEDWEIRGEKCSEEVMKSEDLHSESIDNSIFNESEFRPRANSEVLEVKDEHLRKEEKEEWEIRGEKCSEEVLTDEWKRKSGFPKQHVDSDSPMEILGEPEIVKLRHSKISEVVPMDVDFEGQMEKKWKNEANADGEPREEPAKRQRRWNSGKNLLEASNTKLLTSDTLKNIIPQEAVEVSIGSSSLHPVVSHPASSASQFLSKAEKTSFSRPAPPPLKPDSTSNGEIQKPRIVPPPMRSPTNSLKVERFLRPFTVKALKELLSETGTFRYFWIDQIKTHCYVTYSSVEEAVATRDALFNLKWPMIGGRLLIAEFVDPEEVKLHCEGDSANFSNSQTPVACNNITHDQPTLAPQGSFNQAIRSPPLPDLKAIQTLVSKKDAEPEPAVYTLDDLFKKTRAKPHIYYLPLNEEQVAAKLAARSQDQQKQTVNKPSVKA